MNDVTIVIPVYNSEKYISRCLDSILAQTYKDINILVINDGSKDNSQKIINEYKERYDNIIAIEQENMGVSKTRNKAINMVKTKYIMFIDNDDYIDIDYVENHIKYIKEENLDVVMSGYRRITENKKILKNVSLEDEEWSKFMVLAPWAKIYKREYLIEKNIRFLENNIGEDVYFNMQALQLTNKIKIIKYVGYNWFFNTKSISNTSQKNYKELNVFGLLNKTYEVLKKDKILEEKYEINELYFYRYIIWFLIFSMKKAKKRDIYIQYNEMFKWFTERFPNYKKNKLIGIGSPKGEKRSLQFLYLIFRIAQKIKCAPIIIYVITR